MKRFLIVLALAIASTVVADTLFTANFDEDYVTPNAVTGIVYNIMTDIPEYTTNTVIAVVSATNSPVVTKSSLVSNGVDCVVLREGDSLFRLSISNSVLRVDPIQ